MIINKKKNYCEISKLNEFQEIELLDFCKNYEIRGTKESRRNHILFLIQYDINCNEEYIIRVYNYPSDYVYRIAISEKMFINILNNKNKGGTKQ